MTQDTPQTTPTTTITEDGYVSYIDEDGNRRYPFVAGPKRSELSPLADFGYRRFEEVISGVLWVAVKLGIIHSYDIIDIEDCGANGVAPDHFTRNRWGRWMTIVKGVDGDVVMARIYRAG